MGFINSILPIIGEACLDTLKAVPILFAVYILVSYFEHNTHKFNFKKAEKFGPILGAGMGTIPQCGFSVAMADLYNKKNISLGTLIAVFIATSDEAIPILFSNFDFFVPMLMLILIKFMYAVIVGYIIDIILSAIHKKRQNHIVLEHAEHDACECGHEHHNHEHTKHCCADNIFIDAIKHTLKITIFILIVNLVMGLIVELSGLNLATIANVNEFAQPFITSLIGLVPNCIASVLLVTVYMNGGIAFGSLVSGLCTGAGLGLLVLFKSNKKSWLKNLGIIGIVYSLGVILGLAINLIW